MPPKARILIVGDSPAIGTGMAEVIRLIFEDLLQRYPDSYEVEQIGLFHFYAVTIPKWPVYPTKTIKVLNSFRLDESDIWGHITLREKVDTWRPDLVFAFNDPQSIKGALGIKARLTDIFLQVKINGDMALLQAIEKMLSVLL